MRPNPRFPVDFVTFTEEIFNGKLIIWSSAGTNSCTEGGYSLSPLSLSLSFTLSFFNYSFFFSTLSIFLFFMSNIVPSIISFRLIETENNLSAAQDESEKLESQVRKLNEKLKGHEEKLSALQTENETIKKKSLQEKTSYENSNRNLIKQLHDLEERYEETEYAKSRSDDLMKENEKNLQNEQNKYKIQSILIIDLQNQLKG